MCIERKLRALDVVIDSVTVLCVLIVMGMIFMTWVSSHSKPIEYAPETVQKEYKDCEFTYDHDRKKWVCRRQ